jgi:hypothetical protein
MFIGAFDFCAYSTKEVHYFNKLDPSIKIVTRDFGCGAVDSAPPIKYLQRVEEYTKYFIQVEHIDTFNIDHSKWIKK